MPTQGITGGAGTTCTTQKPGGEFCDDPGIPGAPYPVCVRHAAQLYRFLHERVSAAEFGTFDHVLEGMEVVRRDSGRYHDATGPTEVVYYLAVGDLLKIGRTTNLRQRRATYPPNHRLLATEHGGHGLEGRRLTEFGEYLASGREWFRPGPRLVEHVNALRRAAGARPIGADTPVRPGR